MLDMKYQYRNIGDIDWYITNDSRGIPLSEGDCVILYSKESIISKRLGKIIKCKNNYGKEGLRATSLTSASSKLFNYNDVTRDTFVLKITSQVYHFYLSKMNNATERELEDLDALYNHRCYLYKTSNNKSSIKGLRMMDWVDRKVPLGSLVLYEGKEKVNNSMGVLSYGLVISDTQILTEHMTKVTVHSVLVLEDEILTQKELELKKGLIMQYKKSVVKLQQSSLNVGDIYINKSSYFMYVGDMDLSANIVSSCNVCFELEEDIKNVKWIELSIQDFNYLDKCMKDTSNEMLIKVLYEALCTYKSKVEKYYINQSLYATFEKIYEISSFVKEIPKKSSYVGHINLPPHLFMNLANVKHDVYKHYTFTWKFKV